MKNLRKLFCVACAVLFFTSCEETYNDKVILAGRNQPGIWLVHQAVYTGFNLQRRETNRKDCQFQNGR